jgi:hypothetical protein
LNAPWSLQAQCTGKQRFNPDGHLKGSQKIQTPPRGFVDNSEYRVPHKPHRALLLSILSQFPHGMTRGPCMPVSKWQVKGGALQGQKEADNRS